MLSSSVCFMTMSEREMLKVVVDCCESAMEMLERVDSGK